MVVVKYLFQIGISVLLSLFMGVVQSASPTAAERLQTMLGDVDNVIADFSQQISNGQGRVIEEAQGTLYLAKPRFRWEVLSPFPQIVLANAERIEVYDPDLEQVTQRDIEGAVTQAPLALLTQAQLVLTDHFEVNVVDVGPQSQRFILLPLSAEALYERLELEFHGKQLAALIIVDHAGQKTNITFSNYQSAQVIQSSVFELEYPSGTDFVRG